MSDNKKSKQQLIKELDVLRRQVLDISEQEDTQRKFLSSNKQYQRAEEIAQIGSFVVNVSTGKMKWSDQVYRLLGLEPGEIEPDNASYWGFVCPEDLDRLTEESGRVFAKAEDMDVEYTIIRKDGHRRNIRTRSDSEFDENGNLLYIWGFSQDITDRKRSEEALRESERRLSLHLQNTPIVAIEWSLDFRVTEWNAAAERVFGYTKAEALGRHAAGLIVPESAREHVNQVWNGLLESTGGIHSTNENFTKDGRTIVCDWNNTPLVDESGKVYGVASLVQDITDRVKAVEALSESEEKFSKAFHANESLMAISSLEQGTMLEVNPQFLRTLKLDRDEIIGRLSSELDIWANYAQRDEILTTIKENGFVRNVKVDVRASDGEICNGIFSAHPIELRGERCLLTQMSDITDRRLAEERVHFLSQVTEQVTDSIITTDLDYRITYVNKAFEELYGYTKEEVIGQSPDIVSASSTKKQVQAEIYKAVSSGREWRGEVENRRKDGSTFPCELTVYPVTNDTGLVLAYASTQRDITERKRAEERLTATTTFLDRIVDMSPFAMWISDSEGVMIRSNRSLRDTLGLTDEQLIGNYNVLKDENLVKQNLMPAVKSVFEKHEAVRFDMTWNVSDAGGVKFEESRNYHVDVSMFPVIDSRGKLVNVVCQWVDITERKQAEKSLAESENKFRSIAEHAVDCIFIKDIDRRYVFVNQAIQDLFGLPEEEILGRTPQDIFGHESGLVVAELDDRTFSGETVNETRSLEVGDKEMFFHTIQTPLTSEKDAITSIMGIVRDVTETKHAEEELRRSKRTAESYLNIAAEIIVSLNAQGNITMMNESGHAILGYDKGDLIGKDWFDTCLPERLRKDVRMVFKQLMQGDVENVRTFENPIVTKDGIEKIVLWHNSILRDETGNICGILSSGEDITETKRLQELESRAQRLETAGTIAGQVAHDFNNLLAPLMAYPDLIREDLALNHPALAYLDDIEDSAKKIADINQQLLTLGRRGHYNQVALNLNAIIHQAVKELAPLADDVTCTTDLAPDLMNILGGASQLHRVTTNILSNAVDALQNVGHIHVKTESYYADDVSGAYGRVPKGEYVKLTISDTGCGMSDDIAQKIFDPFFTTKSTDMKRGSGLGLSVVDAVVKDHGGYLDIETIVGKGTSFYVYFPITREALNDDRSGETCGGSESILIVDDEGIQREVSTQLLEKLGYDVNSVDSGEKALKCLRENPYDLVVLDMVMPCGIDGAETYRQILEINPAQKAIIMSGFSETDRVQVAMKLGAGAFVKKPVTRQTIAVAVRTELDRQANILI